MLIVLVCELSSYGLLGLRDRSVSVALPDPAPHARDTRLRQRVRALRQRRHVRVVAEESKHDQLEFSLMEKLLEDSSQLNKVKNITENALI